MDNSTNSTCDEWPDNPGYCVAIEVGRTLTAVLSLLGCLFMILIIWLFRKYQFFVQRLILWLTIAAFLDAVGYVIATDQVEKNTLCIFQAFWITLFDWTVLLWVTCLTFNLFLIVLKLKKTDHLEWIYHLISWAGSLIIACIPFSNGIVYGPANTLCWIKAGANAFRFAIWYVPLVILLILMVSAYLYIVFIINRRSKTWSGSYDPEMERKMTLLKSDIKSLRFYPLVFLVLNVFPLINRIQNAAHGGSTDKPVFALAFLASISGPLQGFGNAVVYGVDKETISKLTWLQIKTGFQQRFGHVNIGEYPAETRPVTSVSSDVTSENDN